MRYLGRKAAFYLVAVWAALSLNFLLPRMMPGNPVDVIIARTQNTTPLPPEARHALELQFGVGGSSLWHQYCAVTVSTVIGVVGGYLGGAADELLSLLTNVVLVLPGLPLVIMITDYVGNRSLLVIALVIAFTTWAAPARILRSQVLSLRNRDYVAAAKVSGERTWRIMAFEILPNLVPIIASQFVFGLILAILTDAGLAFLGLGNLDGHTWGSMLYFAQNGQALQLGAWWWFVPPGACIALFGTGLSLINFGLDELLNPRLRAWKGTTR